MKTKAAILYELNHPLVIDDVEIPVLKPGQVLVKILSTGICRAQYNEIIGLKGPDKFLPHLLGHEASAIVEDLGPGVKKVKKGDYVILSWIKGSGRDVPNSQYKLNGKIVNAGAVTTFSEFSVVSENRVTKISSKIPNDIAAIIGCAVATGGGIVQNTLDVRKASSIAVFGVGGIGLSAILAAKMRGAATIIAVDIHEQKLAFAKELGATHAINSHNGDPLTRIQEIVPGGVDYAVDASGVKLAMELGFEALNTKGTLVIAGNLPRDQRISLHPFELIKGKKIVGTWGGETSPDEDFQKYAAAYQKKKLALDKLITHRFKLSDINQAFDVLQKGEAGRIIVAP